MTHRPKLPKDDEWERAMFAALDDSIVEEPPSDVILLPASASAPETIDVVSVTPDPPTAAAIAPDAPPPEDLGGLDAFFSELDPPSSGPRSSIPVLPSLPPRPAHDTAPYPPRNPRRPGAARTGRGFTGVVKRLGQAARLMKRSAGRWSGARRRASAGPATAEQVVYRELAADVAPPHARPAASLPTFRLFVPDPPEPDPPSGFPDDLPEQPASILPAAADEAVLSDDDPEPAIHPAAFSTTPREAAEPRDLPEPVVADGLEDVDPWASEAVESDTVSLSSSHRDRREEPWLVAVDGVRRTIEPVPDVMGPAPRAAFLQRLDAVAHRVADRLSAARTSLSRRGSSVTPDDAPTRAPWLGTEAILILLCVVGLAELTWIVWGVVMPWAVDTGTLTIKSTPEGAYVLVDGVAEGRTPVSVAVRAGERVLEVRGADASHVVTLSVTKGAQITRSFELRAETGPGALTVQTDVPGARVSVDGSFRGLTPLTISDLEAGSHIVAVTRGRLTGTQIVTIRSNASLSLVVPLVDSATPEPGSTEAVQAAGWLTVSATVPVELYESKRRVGSSRSRLALTPGRHELEAVSEPFGIRVRTSVTIVAGRTSSVSLEIPPGTLNINVLPWATVRIDGAVVGETPLANLRVPAGEHSIAFTHPQLGERRMKVTVKSGVLLRVTTDLSK